MTLLVNTFLALSHAATYKYIQIQWRSLLSPSRGMEEKPSPLGEDVSSIFLPQGFKGKRKA
jgi:hypothetical protein